MNLTLDHGGSALILNLGETSDTHGIGFFDDGDLAATGGNLTLHIDGVEYGQLFFYTENGQPRIELGQYHPGAQGWEPANPLTTSVPDLIAASENEQNQEN